MIINPLSQVNASISEELRNKMHLKMKEARIKAHNTGLKCFKDLFSKMEKVEDSVWISPNPVNKETNQTSDRLVKWKI
jgi:hypothetical protein